MMKNRFITVTLLLPLLFSSCKTIFTPTLRASIENISSNEIERVQFYNSEKIELLYKTSNANDKVEGGKLKFENGFYHYYLTIPKGTRAQGKYHDPKRLKIYFEEGEDRYLIFGVDRINQYATFFSLYGTTKNNGFYVNFEGKEFLVLEGSRAWLEIKDSDRNKFEKDKRKVRGVRVD